MAALLYLFFNNPPNKKKKSPYIKNGWLYYFRTHPLLLSLSLSFSLSPSARPLPPQKRTHCYKEQKKKKGCVTACKLHCYLFVSFLSLTPHLPSSLFSPLSRSLFLYPPHPPQPLKSGSVTNPTDLPGVTVTCQITRNNSRFLHCRPRHKSIKYGHLIFSGAPTVVLQKKKRNYFGAAAVGLGTRLYIYVCVWACACVWVLGRDWERERVSERGGLGKSAAAMPRLTSDCIA